MSLSKQTLKLIGLITVGIFCLFGVAAVIMAGISYQVIDADWAQGPWRHFAPINLAVTIYCIFCSIIGFMVFTCCAQAKPIILIYLFIMLLSLLFSWAIGIFASIGGTIGGKIDDLLGCKSPMSGVLELWRNVDNYYQLADSILCTPACPCKLYTDVHSNFKNHYLTTSSWTKTDTITTLIIARPANEENQVKFNFQSCSDDARQLVHDLYIGNSNNTKQYIKQEEFADYWKGIEKRFECVGWCNLKYKNMFTLQDEIMGNYVFSDINRGVVKYPGCLYRLTHWIPSLIGAIGGCLIFAGFIQTISWFIALSLLLQPLEIDDEDKIDYNQKKKGANVGNPEQQ